MTEPQKINFTTIIPGRMLRECRATTLERILVDGFRVEARRTIKEAKAELR